MRFTRLDRLVARFRRYRQRHHTRQCLRDLNSHLLKDIGMTRFEAEREARKSFWE